jgi:hypothetical protein
MPSVMGIRGGTWFIEFHFNIDINVIATTGFLIYKHHSYVKSTLNTVIMLINPKCHQLKH